MKTQQIKAMIAELAPVIRDFVASETAPLLRRIGELEFRQPECGQKGADGKDGTDGAAGANGRDGADGRDGVDGAAATDEQIALAVARYLEANPPAAGKDGRDGVDGAAGIDGKDGAAGRDGVDGAPGEKGADGRDGVDGAAGRDGVNGKDGAAGEKGADGADGVGLAGAVIDRDGDLVVTLTNGEHKNLGPVLGKDGSVGRDGAPGKDGADGRDGADGLGFDDFDLIEGDKGLLLRFSRGALVKEFPLPVPLDYGVWKPDDWRKGAGVTWAGSWWIAQKDTGAKPDTPDSGWRLAVKRGRDGKDGRNGERGPEGQKGRDGRDLTQVGADGGKW